MRLLLLTLIALLALAATAQSPEAPEEKKSDFKPTLKIGGTLRAKYEWQTDDGESRFEVRTARANVSGYVLPAVEYKAEIDLCDEGKIKMLDAYVRLHPWKHFQFTIGQERVPFTIDAHRSPHQQYFANRSFLAKQVGNVRDVGAEVGYTFDAGFPIITRFGIFNGSGLTNQKDYWTKSINFSGKVEARLPMGLDVVGSIQKVKPGPVTVMMYDAGLTLHRGGFIAEAEYLYKHYGHDAFHPVHSFDTFMSYDIPCHQVFKKVSPLLRYDYMSDHSDGTANDEGQLVINDYKRSRITGGVTLSLGTPFQSDIRVNYEKYLYRHDAVKKTSERDKLVVEFVVHF